MNSGSLWDNAGPLGRFLLAVFLGLWIIAALVPAIAMISKEVACAVGAAETLCPKVESR